jgi:hypothetical protein
VTSHHEEDADVILVIVRRSAALIFAVTLLFFALTFILFHMSRKESLYKAIEAKRSAFEENEHPRPSNVIIDRFNELLQENDSSWSKLCPGRQLIRRRARDHAILIQQEVGREVLLLVVLVVKAIDKILDVKLIDRLKTWWGLAVHPGSLTCASKRLIMVPAPREIIPVSQQLPVDAAPGQHAVAALGMFILLLLIYD